MTKSSVRQALIILLLSAALGGCGTPRNSNTVMDMQSLFSDTANSELSPSTSPRMVTKMIMRGQTSEIASVHDINPDCSSDTAATIKVIQEPMHGTAAIVPREGLPHIPASDPRSRCNKRPVPGIALDYTPEDGFHGNDMMTIKASFHSGNEISETQFLINVK